MNCSCVLTSPSRGLRFVLHFNISFSNFPVSIFPGPMTDGDERREPATVERCRGELDDGHVAIVLGEKVSVTGPVTDNDGGRMPIVAERYR